MTSLSENSARIAIDIRGLSKTYGRRSRKVHALRDLNLSVPLGRIFGLVGPNGSGKTTTIRILLGLVRPTAGSCSLLGVPPARLSNVIDRVGVVSEAQRFYPSLSGRKNLEHLALIRRLPTKGIDAALDRGGLIAAAHRPFGQYSLGMKQRLGLAAALLKDPQLLILDEPTNGLDPHGVVEMRRLILELGEEGRTVLLCSHLLSEVEAVCDSVAIMSQGRALASGRLADIRNSLGPPRLLVRVRQIRRALSVLKEAGFEAAKRPPFITIEGWSPSLAEKVSKALAQSELHVQELRHEEGSLEDAFLQLSAGEDQESA